jgi:hypothetical protein
VIEIHVDVSEAIRALRVDLRPAFGRVTRAIGERIRQRISTRPGPARHPVIWKSEEQRKAYFARRRDRKLPPEFDRDADPMSLHLPASWRVRQRGNFNAQAYTGIWYAHFVQQKKAQQPFHRATGWTTDQQVVDEVARSGDVERITESELAGLLASSQ